MVLGFMTKFKNGQPTNFVKGIIKGYKIHTIRKGSRWKAGDKIHFATGVRTKNYNQFKIGECVSVQKIQIIHKPMTVHVYVDNKHVGTIFIRKSLCCNFALLRLIHNDGLSLDNFYDFFNQDFEGQIIHWTELKY